MQSVHLFNFSVWLNNQDHFRVQNNRIGLFVMRRQR